MTSTLSHDQLHRFVFDDCDLRGEVLTLQKSYQDAVSHQNLPPVARKLLGEFLAAARLLSDILKFTGTLTLQARGSGPIPLIMAESNEDGSVRGIVKLTDDHSLDSLSEANLAELLGDGVLSMTLDPTKGQRYQGMVPLEGDNLADALCGYFAQSEQLPTKLWLFSDGEIAGGLLLQALPNQQVSAEVNAEQWLTAETLAQTLTQEEINTLGHHDILYRLFNEFKVRVFEPGSVHFHCRCSRERCRNALASLGRPEVESIIEERDVIDMSCEFCGTQYTFGTADLDDIFGPEQPALH